LAIANAPGTNMLTNQGEQIEGGTSDQELQRANRQLTRDKESPLWDPLAPLIYL
jgi:hypothetical protein